MSTRCQVQVIEEGKDIFDNEDYEQKLTLYHHCDGYPRNMLKLFWDAWKAMHSYTYNQYKKKGFSLEDCKRFQEYSNYQLDRCGYVSSFLCYVDPTGFNPLDYHDFHGDIEYYYRIYTKSAEQDKGIWEIEIYKGFWGEDPKLMVSRKPLDFFITKKSKVSKNFLKKLDKIEKELYDKIPAN